MTYSDPLIEEDPVFGGIIKERAEEARAETISAWKEMLLQNVRSRFPSLAASIGKADLPNSNEELKSLGVLITTTPDEETVRRLLHLPED